MYNSPSAACRAGMWKTRCEGNILGCFFFSWLDNGLVPFSFSETEVSNFSPYQMMHQYSVNRRLCTPLCWKGWNAALDRICQFEKALPWNKTFACKISQISNRNVKQKESAFPWGWHLSWIRSPLMFLASYYISGFRGMKQQFSFTRTKASRGFKMIIYLKGHALRFLEKTHNNLLCSFICRC